MRPRARRMEHGHIISNNIRSSQLINLESKFRLGKSSFNSTNLFRFVKNRIYIVRYMII